MKKVYVNEDWCLGCHLCEFTCAAADSGAPDMIKAFAGGKKPVARIQIEEGDKINFAVQCRHCDAHPCVKGCIAGALSVQDGVIVCDEEKCVGCYTAFSHVPTALSSSTRRDTRSASATSARATATASRHA